MPAGVYVEVVDGFAIIEFADKAQRGPGLDALLKVGGPATVEKLSREKGARYPRYRVPEGNAREAGLLDEPGTLSDVTQFGAGEATGIVLPETPTSAGLVHAPVLRQGTYRGGDGGDVETVASDPVPTELSPANHAQVIENVKPTGPVQPQGVEPEAYPAPEPGGAFIGMQGLGEAVEPSAPAEVPAEADAPAEPVLDASEPQGGDAVVIDGGADGDVAVVAKTGDYPDGEPDEDWKRVELNAYAKDHGVDTSDPKKYPSKASVLAALGK